MLDLNANVFDDSDNNIADKDFVPCGDSDSSASSEVSIVILLAYHIFT